MHSVHLWRIELDLLSNELAGWQYGLEFAVGRDLRYGSLMEQIKNICLRILATFAASGLGVVGAGTIAGVPLYKAIFMAGIAGVATVVEGLSRAFLDDGKLSLAEINDVFNKVDRKNSKDTAQ